MSLVATVREVLLSLADFLFPPVCLLCEGECRSEEKVCERCASVLAEEALRYEPPPRSLEHVRNICVLLPYDEACRKIVHAFKYHNLPSLAEHTGGLLSRKMLARIPEYREALLVPVPLHPDKLRERGYNQCELIARGFAAFSGQSIRSDLLARTVYTGTQTALSQEDRKNNVRGVFAYTGKTALTGKSVILLDDVMTTGSTLSECARVLAETGAERIAVCVVATPDEGER